MILKSFLRAKAHNFVYILYKLAHDPQSGNILYVLFQSGQVDIPDFRLFQYAFLCFDTSRNEFDGVYSSRYCFAIPFSLTFSSSTACS